MSSTLRFAQFEIEPSADGTPKELGRGGMGVTYKAFDTRLRRPVVLKVIRDGLLNDDTASRRFLREARAAARIQHPNIATVFDQGHEGNTFFYAMEFIEGETFQSLIRREGTLPPKLALEIILQVAKALQAAWGEKVIHRDIKPANIMLAKDHYGSGDLVVKLIDFGLAKAAVARRAEGAEGGDDGPITLTQDGGLTAGFVGTPHFASPEQIEPDGELDIRSDIYSLGVTLWYALAGSPPFSGSSFVRVAAMHLSKAPPFEELGGAPAPVLALLKRMLAKEREDRPTDPTELRREIEATLRALESGAVPGPAGARVAVSSAGITPIAAGVESIATLVDSVPSAVRLPPTTPPQSTPRPSISLPPPPPPPLPPAQPVVPPPPLPPAAPAWPPVAGAVLAGRWQLVQAVGEDMTGKLFRAVDRAQGNQAVAIRALRPGIASDAGQLARAREACAIVARLGQPALVSGLSLQTIPEGTFATLDWLESHSLQDLLRTRGGVLPASEVQSILEQCSPACDAAAGEGLNTLDLHLGQVALHLPDGPPQEGWSALLARPLAHWPRWQVKINALDLFNNDAPPAPDADAGAMTMVGGASLGGADARPLAQRYAAALAALGYELLGGSPQRVEPRRLQSQGYTSVATLGEDGNQVLKTALLAAPGQGFASSAQFIAAFAPTLPRRSLPPATVAGGMPGMSRASLAPAPPPVAPPPAPPVSPVNTGGGSNKGILIGVAAAVLIVGGGLAWKFLGGKKVDDDPRPDSPPPTPSVVASRSTPTPPPATGATDDRATAGLSAQASSIYRSMRSGTNSPSVALVRTGRELYLGSKLGDAVVALERATELDSANAASWDRLALVRSELGRFDAAKEAAERATQLDPKLTSAWTTLGDLLLERAEYDPARAAYEKAVAAMPNAPRDATEANAKVRALIGLSRTQLPPENERTLARATTAGREGTGQFPKDSELASALAITFLDARDLPKAIEAFQRASALRPDFYEPWIGLAAANREAKQESRAVEAARKATQLAENSPYPWHHLGMVYGQFKKWDEAVTAYRRALSFGPEPLPVLNGFGESLLRNGRPRDALAPLQKATRLAPNSAVSWKSLAEARRRTQEDRGVSAIEAAERAVRLAPQYADAHYELGAAYNVALRYSDAITSLRRATELTPSISIAWNALGLAYHGSKQLQQALDAFLRATKEDPNYALAWDNAGEIYRQRGEKQSALDAFRRATVADPSYADGWIDTGRMLCDFKQFDEALKSFQRATEVAPRVAAGWQWVGYAYNELKQHERAVPAFRKAVEISPNYAVAWNNLGFAYEALSRSSDAIDAYERATKADPQLQVAWRSLANLYDKAGRTADASRARANGSGTPPKPTLGPGPTPRGGRSDLDAVLKEMENLGGSGR